MAMAGQHRISIRGLLVTTAVAAAALATSRGRFLALWGKDVLFVPGGLLEIRLVFFLSLGWDLLNFSFAAAAISAVRQSRGGQARRTVTESLSWTGLWPFAFWTLWTLGSFWRPERGFSPPVFTWGGIVWPNVVAVVVLLGLMTSLLAGTTAFPARHAIGVPLLLWALVVMNAFYPFFTIIVVLFVMIVFFGLV